MAEVKGHTELLPCPFCGDDNASFNAPDKSINFKGSINCPACLASMPREVNSDQELIDCWNTRAAVNTYPAVEGLVKALEETLKFIESQMHYSQPSYDSGLEPSDQFTYDASPVACAAQDALSRFRSLQNGGQHD